MKIRRLDIQGFKSFADRTKFEFGDGISSIVGPNGCGKSNVVDAVKWVLGDMSPKSLRGKRMEDVIFAGSRNRRSLGLAEVTLTLENGSGLLRTDRTEVSITRRLHRNGVSEYLLCGEKARLKDIRELFMDTGLGAGGNAIMEQGQIDALLAANPQDRRGIFEEAAGVSRYKQRRKEADQRLGRTHENLERLLDVLELEEKRLRSLKNQAGRARRYQELRQELGRKRVLRAVLRYRRVHEERTALQEGLREALGREQAAAEELSELETRTREAEAARTAAREAAHATETRIAGAESDIRAAEERIVFLRRSREELAERIAAAGQEATRARERGKELEAEEGALALEIQEGEAAAEAELQRLEAAEAELRRLDTEVSRIRDYHETAKREIVVLLGRVSEAKNRESTHRADVRQTEERLIRLGRQAVDFAARRRSVEAEVADLGRERSRLEEAAGERRARFQALESRRLLLADVVREARARHAETAEERATKVARLGVLERLAEEGEGLAEGVRAILDAIEDVAPADDGSREGVLGVLADLVRPEVGEAAVLDRLIGHAAGALIVRSSADALRWIAWLREHRDNARARFLCLDLVRDVTPPLPDVVGPLGCPALLEGLVASVATGTLLVDDLDLGIAHWRETGTNAVTPAGDRVTASGALLGGEDAQAFGLVERRAELLGLRQEVERLDRALARSRSTVQDAEAGFQAAEAQVAEIRSALARDAEDRSRGGEALARAEKERRQVLESQTVLQAEREELEAAHADAHEAAAVAGRRVAGLGEECEVLEARAEEAARGFLATETARRSAAERRMEIRLVLAEARARRESARGRAERAAAEARALTEKATALDAEAETLETRRARSEIEVAESEALIRRRREERASAADELVETKARLEELERTAGTEEARRREVQQLHEELRSHLEEFRLKDSELRVRIEALTEQVRQDQGLDIVEVDKETPATEDVDLDAMDEDVEQIRRRLEGLGNVNLNAIAELEEVQEHVDFLHGQQKDLLQAKADLESVIAELDEITTTRFAETFEQVRSHFNETFRRLFGGGRADIILEDASNVLESGVDIVARPPGKEQRTISLLSGGERTLTAVALLFAVFKAKPSPFAILDEVDAALDEANVRRLVGLVREFTDRSQFLMVTHAKTTMEAADLLYGVTMQEPGVSKKVAVRLTEYETMAG